MPKDWEETSCAVCGGISARPVLQVPHPDAPGGISRIVACDTCGLRRLNPRPGPGAIGGYYAAASGYNAYVGRKRGPRAQQVWDFLRDGFARPAGVDGLRRLAAPATRPLARWLFDINVPLHGRRNTRVLEVGSGYGDLLIYLQSRGCEVLGTDLSEEAALKARAYGVEVRVGNLIDLHLPPESFDTAVLCHSLEHVPDPNVELGELRRLLTPRGRVHIAVPNGAAVRLALDGVHWAHLSHPFHFWFFDPQNLVRLVKQHGFTPVASPTTTTRHHAVTAWWQEGRQAGWGRSTRRLLRFLRHSLGRADGGDVLRLVAER